MYSQGSMSTMLLVVKKFLKSQANVTKQADMQQLGNRERVALNMKGEED